MKFSLIKEPLNTHHIIHPSTTRIKESPSDTTNIPRIINYLKESSPEDLKREKINKNDFNFFSSHNRKHSDDKIKINKTFYDINNLTINHNINLTNLNLYFLYNSENPKKTKKEKKIKKQNLNTINNKKDNKKDNKKEPLDTIRKKIFLDRKNHPNDKNVNNRFLIKYLIKRANTKSPVNNKALSTIQKNNQNKNGLTLVNETNKENIQKNNSKNIPKGKLILSEFTIINQIGKGTFGKIFSVKWKKNNKIYVLKKEIFKDLQFVEKRNKIIKIITDFIDKTKHKGIIQIYSTLCEKNKDNYNYYELMELGEQDWEKEINSRRDKDLYYTEKELLNIAYQLVSTLSLLQKNHITHRDIKPQNILIVNGKYKLCDFGEIRIMEREGLVVQRIRGSELYMSPILFFGLRDNLIQVKHNTYKSDVFSLGMCLLFAATMYFNCPDQIREMTDMNTIDLILNRYLRERYSNKFISLVYLMLQIEEQLRPDFIQLEEKLKNLL